MECPTAPGMGSRFQSLAIYLSICLGVLLAAMKRAQSFFLQLLSVTSFSQIIDNVGKHFEFRVQDIFARYRVSMFSNSPVAHIAWKNRTGTAMQTYSPTRLWRKYEVMRQEMRFAFDVEPFLRENN